MLHKGNRSNRCKGGPELQREYNKSLFGVAREPLEREKYHQRYLGGHEELKEMGRSSLVGLATNAH